MRTRGTLVATLCLALLACAPTATAAVTLPPEFADQSVTSVGSPTALAFTPDGRLLITTQPGRLRVYSGGNLLAAPALDLSSKVCGDSERGLLGVAVDPGFAVNHFVYLFYTWKKFNGCATSSASSPVNRVSRFTLGDTNTADPATELVLIDNMPSPAGTHNAGDLQFGRDGNLYATIGDGGCDYAGGGCGGSNDAARDQNVLTGKVLRIAPDGGIPAGNPYQGSGTARCNLTGRTDAGKKCQETFAWGLRNPFRLAFDPNAAGTRFHINDVGQNTWEEIDDGQAGADYGWNVREGHCATGSTSSCGTPAGMTNPVYDYDHSTGCSSITGGSFVPNGTWPASYQGAYLFADYVCGSIFRLVPQGGGAYTRSTFASGLGGSSAVHLTFGPSGSGQALYYTTYAGGGEVRRIFHSPVNRPPTAELTASPATGDPPLAVTLDGSNSSDPDAGDTLTYVWDFGDGSPTSETSSATTTHSYAAGTYTATLTVRDDHGATSSPDGARIDSGNTAPEPTIGSPAAGQRFAVGETLTLSGSASDPQEGPLPASALSWTVLRHHADHTHPYAGPTEGNDIPISGPAPEDLAAAANSYLEVQLTATDPQGLSATVTRRVDPKLVDLTFATQPSGQMLVVNGLSFTAPRTFTSWQGWDLSVNAPDQGSYVFSSWSDGGGAAHVIRTPASAGTYTATYRSQPSIQWVGPTDGATVSGRYSDSDGGPSNVSVNTAGGTVDRVEFRVDGAFSGDTERAAPWELTWNSASVPNGSHTLNAKLYLTNGQTAQQTITVNVQNGGPPPPPPPPPPQPSIEWVIPTNGATVSGAYADDGGPSNVAPTLAGGTLQKIEFRVDGVLKNTELGAPYELVWNTATVPNGSHSLNAKLYLTNGQTAQQTITVNVQNAAPPPPPGPSIQWVNPTNGATVSGAYTLDYRLNDVTVNLAGKTLDRIEFRVDGVLKNTERNAPYELLWNTATVANGSHSLNAKLFLTNGQTAQQTITVNVQN